MQSSVSQLLIEAGFGELVDDLVAFVRTLGDQETPDEPSSHDDNTTHAAVIMQTIEDLLTVVSDQPLPMVRPRMNERGKWTI